MPSASASCLWLIAAILRRMRTRAPTCLSVGSRSEEHTSELSHGYISYAVFCLKKKKRIPQFHLHGLRMIFVLGAFVFTLFICAVTQALQSLQIRKLNDDMLLNLLLSYLRPANVA